MINPADTRMAFLNAQMELISRIAANMLGDPLPAEPQPQPGAQALPPTKVVIQAPVAAGLLGGLEGSVGAGPIARPAAQLPPAETDSGHNGIISPAQSLAGLRPANPSIDLSRSSSPETPLATVAEAPRSGPAVDAEPLALASLPAQEPNGAAPPQGQVYASASPAAPATISMPSAPPPTALVQLDDPSTAGALAAATTLTQPVAPPSDRSQAEADGPRPAPSIIDKPAEATPKAVHTDDVTAGPAGFVHQSAGAPQVPVVRHEAASDIDMRFLNEAASSLGMAGGTLNDTGITAALIFNAAMIPGWPPPRPFEMPTAEALTDALLGNQRFTRGTEGLTHEVTAQIGSGSIVEILHRFLRRLSASRRLRLLLGLAALSSAIEDVLDAIESELLHLANARTEDDSTSTAGNFRRRFSA